ncbi:MAG: NADH-ubiquinone oxidoreductase-F iron-sulfur binding region domain-containing protein [Ilumatobacteraceae bacterium]
MTQTYLLPPSPIERIDDFLSAGGGRGLERALQIGKTATIDLVTAAGLRGRGGAGFSVGRKWASVRDGGAGTRFVVANGAEGEPATFKDRMLPGLLPPYELGLFATDLAIGWESGNRPVSGRAEANPTVVNNVETLASAAHILANGVEWFRAMGTHDSPGTIIATVVGDVVRPGVHEVEMGTPFSELLAMCGGPLPGRRYKAAFSGVSNAVLPADAFETPLTYEHFAARGSGLGAAGFVVYDDSVNMTLIAYELSRFLAAESCGQCPPCKQGSLAITADLASICDGGATDAVLGQLATRLRAVTDANRCFLGSEEQVVVSSILREFPDDVAALLEGRSTSARAVRVPPIDHIADDGTVTHHA